MRVNSRQTSTGIVQATARRRRELVDVEPVVSIVLRWGVLVAAVIVGLGVALYFAQDGARSILFARPGVPPGAETDPASLHVVFDDLILRKAAAVTDTGLLLLIATPVINVVIVLAAFILERDWTYVGIAGFVLAMLIVGLAIGRA